MLETRIPRQEARPPATDGRLARRVASTILGLVSLGTLWPIVLTTAEIADTGDPPGGAPLLAMFLGLVAAGFGAGAVALWSRPVPSKLVAWTFVSILAIAATLFGLVYVVLTP